MHELKFYKRAFFNIIKKPFHARNSHANLVATYSTSGIPICYPFKYWLQNKESVYKNIQQRKVVADIDLVLDLYKQQNALQKKINDLKHQRSLLSSDSLYLQNNIASTSTQIANDTIKSYKKTIQELQSNLDSLRAQLYKEAACIPNDSDAACPLGDDSKNEIIFESEPGFSPNNALNNTQDLTQSRDHLKIGSSLKILDFSLGAKCSGSGFFFLKNEGVLLEFALVQFALQKALQKGFVPILGPDLVYAEFVERCGYSPRPSSNLASLPYYNVSKSAGRESETGSSLALVGTSEISLAIIHANEKLETLKEPIKYVAHSHCFRTEISAGKEMRGLYRVHQFSKVELFILCRPEQGQEMFESIISLQKEIFSELGFKFQILNMASEELGMSAYKKYDVEAWMPGRKSWGELSSASTCTDFQSRRLNIRYRENVEPSERAGQGKETCSHRFVFPWTLNGTGISIPRAILTLLENNLQTDGSVVLPSVLSPWMNGNLIIRPK